MMASAEPVGWACAACTFINDAGGAQCEVCGGARQSEPAPPVHAPNDAGLSALVSASGVAADAHDDAELERAIAMSMEPAEAAAPPAAPAASAGSGAEGADDEISQAIAMSLEGAGAADPAGGEGNPSNAEILRHYESIAGAAAEDIKDKPLVGEIEALDVLKAEYEDGLPAFRAKLDSLGRRYRQIRRARNDGNCFYRGFAFALFEYLLTRASPEYVREVTASAEACRAKFAEAGVAEAVFGDFLDCWLGQLREVEAKRVDVAQLMARWNMKGSEHGEAQVSDCKCARSLCRAANRLSEQAAASRCRYVSADADLCGAAAPGFVLYAVRRGRGC